MRISFIVCRIVELFPLESVVNLSPRRTNAELEFSMIPRERRNLVVKKLEPIASDVSKHLFNIGRARVGGVVRYSRQILILVVPVKGRERC